MALISPYSLVRLEPLLLPLLLGIGQLEQLDTLYSTHPQFLFPDPDTGVTLRLSFVCACIRKQEQNICIRYIEYMIPILRNRKRELLLGTQGGWGVATHPITANRCSLGTLFESKAGVLRR